MHCNIQHQHCNNESTLKTLKHSKLPTFCGNSCRSFGIDFFSSNLFSFYRNLEFKARKFFSQSSPPRYCLFPLHHQVHCVYLFIRVDGINVQRFLCSGNIQINKLYMQYVKRTIKQVNEWNSPSINNLKNIKIKIVNSWKKTKVDDYKLLFYAIFMRSICVVYLKCQSGMKWSLIATREWNKFY
jgi:hypothetical protein